MLEEKDGTLKLLSILQNDLNYVQATLPVNKQSERSNTIMLSSYSSNRSF